MAWTRMEVFPMRLLGDGYDEDGVCFLGNELSDAVDNVPMPLLFKCGLLLDIPLLFVAPVAPLVVPGRISERVS